MNFKKDYYSILGVASTCTREELKAAYRKLAKQYHPDRTPGADPARMQEINEAYEVLANLDKKAIYDEYYNSKKRQSETVTSNTNSSVKKPASHVRTYERKYTVTELEKVFIRGRMHVKFWAEALEDMQQVYMADYRINPVETIIYIHEKDMDVRNVSPEFVNSVSSSEIFKTPISQPILCNVQTREGVIRYMLNLFNIRVANIELKNINKHDNQSLGTLEADVWAELVNTIEKVETEWVSECFGPTGRVETKQQDGWRWKREEFYHADCSTYWGSWERVAPLQQQAESSDYKSKSTTTGGARYQYEEYTSTNSNTKREKWSGWNLVTSEGCSTAFYIILFGVLFIAVPQLRVLMIAYTIFFLLLALGGSILTWIGRFMPYIFGVVIVAFAILGIKGMLSNTTSARPFVQDKPTYDTLVTKKEVDRPSGREKLRHEPYDTLITHTIGWKDYDSVPYEVSLPVRVSSIKESNRRHQELQFTNLTSIAGVYDEMENYDTDALDLVYKAFDSLRKQNDLDEYQFANALVSCVQSIPYYLIVDRECTPALYPDEFIRSYLASCNKSCCLGDVPFGVRSPVEFLSDLKGDCDTRALFLYSLFRKFNYDVVLITSEYYRHAAIAVHLPGEIENVKSVFNRSGKNFYAWETTAFGYRAGILPPQVNNLNNWKITLINE